MSPQNGGRSLAANNTTPFLIAGNDRRALDHMLIEIRAALDDQDADDARLMQVIALWLRRSRARTVAQRDALGEALQRLGRATVLPRSEAA